MRELLKTATVLVIFLAALTLLSSCSTSTHDGARLCIGWENHHCKGCDTTDCEHGEDTHAK